MSQLDFQSKAFADAASKASKEALRKDEEIERLLEELRPYALEAEALEQARSEAYNEERIHYEAKQTCHMCRTAVEQCRFPRQHRASSWYPKPKPKTPFKEIESPSQSTQLLLSLSPKLLGISNMLDHPSDTDSPQHHPSISKLPSLRNQRSEPMYQSGLSPIASVASGEAYQGSGRTATCAF